MLNIRKNEGILRQAEVALGVPGRLWPRIFSTFGTTRVVGHLPNAPAAFTPGEIPGTHFQRLSQPQGTMLNIIKARISFNNLYVTGLVFTFLHTVYEKCAYDLNRKTYITY